MNADPLEELRRWVRRIHGMRQTVVCPPALAPLVQAMVDASGIAGLITVRADDHCPPDRVFIITDAAVALDTTAKTPPPPSPGESRQR